MSTRILKRRRDEDFQSPNNENSKTQPNGNSMDVDGGNKRIKRNPIFDGQTLQQALAPTLETIDAKKYSNYFRMDHSAIKNKLYRGKYSQAWDYVEDVWSMFEKVWHSNPETSPLYQYCTKLSEAFEHKINPVMKSLGYCCGKKYKFDPQELCCSLREHCTVKIDENYFIYQTRSIIICKNCFIGIPEDTVPLDDESNTRVEKVQFIEMKNNVSTPEPFIDCRDCGRQQHQICVLYLERIWPNGFLCDNCLAKSGGKRIENTFRAKNLPVTKLDRHIEARVNDFLKTNNVNGGQIHIRMLHNYEKIVLVKPEMRKVFVEMDAGFPYRSKVIFAFQEMNGVDVCFFGIYVQEYGSECPKPNTRRIYLTFVDSLNFYQPKDYRTAVYQEILLGYIDFAKQLGYIWFHIWACPPPLGENYIFFKHPTDQKIPDSKRLQKWYTKLVQKGKSEGIIVDCKNILQQSKEDDIATAAELPYFDDDYWPGFFEDTISELQGKAKTVKNTGTRRKKLNWKNSTKALRIVDELLQQKIDISSKLFMKMAEEKQNFFSIRLQSAKSTNLNPILDTDSPIISPLMNDHSTFFEFARDNCYEFSTLRRAQFSTCRILYKLHNSHQEFEFFCNICGFQVEKLYHCRVCVDYDLCVDCYNNTGHIHEMDKIGFDLDEEISSTHVQPIDLVTSVVVTSSDDSQINLNVSDNGTSSSAVQLPRQQKPEQQQRLQNDPMVTNVLLPLLKTLTDILCNRDASNEPQVILNSVIRLARVQMHLQDRIRTLNDVVAEPTRNFQDQAID